MTSLARALSVLAPATTSNHIAGNAVDVDIAWTGTIKVKDKTGKLTSDAPHWSIDGH